jgi:gluconate 2-dehydrogenase alpha chain
MNTFGRVPNWGSQWKAFVKENADRSNNSYIQKSTLPYEDNFLDLDPVAKDPLGYPVCRVTANTRRTSGGSRRSPGQDGAVVSGGRRHRDPAGAGRRCDGRVDPRLWRHADGRQPETNVVNRWGFSHEAPNLGVLGASVMGTSGAHNPTLTAQALAWRTAEHLAKNFNSIARRRS